MAYRNGVKIDFSRTAKTTDNAFVESFNGTFRNECLNVHWFLDLKEARYLVEAWRGEDNDSRPHASLKQPALQKPFCQLIETNNRQSSMMVIVVY